MITTNIEKYGNTAYKKISERLLKHTWYNDFLSGKITREEYLKILLLYKAELMRLGLNEDQIHLSTRFSFNIEGTVDIILQDLYEKKVISSREYPKTSFRDLFQKVSDHFEHDHYTTYIFPEEAMLLYALTHIVKPKTMIFLGSYYGYWAIWALMALKEYGGLAYLIDVDNAVLILAKRNIQKFGLDSFVHYIHEDAIKFMAREKIPHDFIVIDPEGPKQGEDPDLLDKAIYYPMIKSADACLAQHGIVLCHNILLTNSIKDDYFDKKIIYNKGQFSKFLPYMAKHYHQCVWYDTTEGIGVFAGKKAEASKW